MNTSKLDFTGRTAIITGAGRGIGRAHALLLASRGANVVVNDLGGSMAGEQARATGPADSVVAEITSAGGAAIASYDDISGPAGATALVASAVAQFGGLDIVINNAGVFHPKPFADISAEQFQRTLMVHVGGHFFVTQAAWPHLEKTGRGRVVNTTSGVALYGMLEAYDYASAKGAILGLTRSLALDGAQRGITVNAIAPVAFTRMADSLSDPEVRRFFEANVRADQVAPIAAWLAHDSCSVNGAVFGVGAGRVGRIFVGETRGIHDANVTLEQIAGNMPLISDEGDYFVPISADAAAELMTTGQGSAPA